MRVIKIEFVESESDEATLVFNSILERQVIDYLTFHELSDLKLIGEILHEHSKERIKSEEI